ncbi:MAG: TonB-dependent receptor, partial [Pseudomonadota bacterium]
GLEFRADWRVGEQDTLGLRYAETDGRYDSNLDNRVDSDLDGNNVSPDRINLSWEHIWSEGINTRLQVSYLEDREFRNRTGAIYNSFDGYTTTDLTAQVAGFGGNFNLSVQNLTNRDYFTYYSQSNPLDVRNFKGVGRSFTVAWQRSF